MNIYIFARDGDTTRLLYNYLEGHLKVVSVILEKEPSKKAFLTRRIKKLGLLMVFGQLIFIVLVLPFLKLKSRKRRKQILFQNSLDISRIPKSKIISVQNINKFRFMDTPPQGSIIIVNGTRILSPQLIRSIKIPIINIHTGITPLFRGVHGGFWAIASGKLELFGTTIHKIDKGIDTGKVILQKTTKPNKEDNYSTYYLLQYAIILPELIEMLKTYSLKKDLLTTEPLTEESRIWSHPTICQWIKYKINMSKFE